MKYRPTGSGADDEFEDEGENGQGCLEARMLQRAVKTALHSAVVYKRGLLAGNSLRLLRQKENKSLRLGTATRCQDQTEKNPE